MMRSFLRGLCLLCCLAVPLPSEVAAAWPDNSPPPYRGPGSQTLPLDEIQRRAYEQDREWARRDDETRRREAEERMRHQQRLEDDRRRAADRERQDRSRDWTQRGAFDEQRLERLDQERLLRRDESKNAGKGGAYRDPKQRGKALDPKELRRYELIQPGERP